MAQQGCIYLLGIGDRPRHCLVASRLFGCTKVTSNEPVSGLRHCFLCNSDAAEEAFKQLALLCPSSANAQDFCDCLALAVSKRT